MFSSTMSFSRFCSDLIEGRVVVRTLLFALITRSDESEPILSGREESLLLEMYSSCSEVNFEMASGIVSRRLNDTSRTTRLLKENTRDSRRERPWYLRSRAPLLSGSKSSRSSIVEDANAAATEDQGSEDTRSRLRNLCRERVAIRRFRE